MFLFFHDSIFTHPTFSSSTNNFAHVQTLSRMSSLSGHMNIAWVNIEFFTGCKNQTATYFLHSSLFTYIIKNFNCNQYKTSNIDNYQYIKKNDILTAFNRSCLSYVTRIKEKTKNWKIVFFTICKYLKFVKNNLRE